MTMARPSLVLVPLIKLLGLVVVLPFGLTYLHFYYVAHWKGEHCFVGPHLSPVGGAPYGGGWRRGDDVADNALRGTIPSDADERDAARKLYGIYVPVSKGKKKKKGGDERDRREFRQVHASASSSSSSYWSGGWPSATQASAILTSPSSPLATLNSRTDPGDDAGIFRFVEGEGGEGRRWCLRGSSAKDNDAAWCSAPTPDDAPEGTVRAHPPSGVWSSSFGEAGGGGGKGASPAVRVSCPSPATLPPQKDDGKHKALNAKQNQNLKFLLDQPATALLLALNVGLAFHYWNRRASPSAVCKQYSKIVGEHEWWRGYAGATAHFEPLHIGFNMMSLNTLGRELEVGYGSVVFLVLNVALVAFTTAVMMGMVYARIAWNRRRLDRTSDPQLRSVHQEQMRKLRETSSVGYSAVLFAWMVISTMERSGATCPVPFFSDVCFETYAVPGIPFLKFNAAPIVSLFAAQFIMPRVSFVGHLAGIVCGFLLHWGSSVWPLELCGPAVLIGGTFLLGLIVRRRVVPVRPLLTEEMDEEGRADHEEYLRSVLDDAGGDDGPDGCDVPLGENGLAADPFGRGKERKRERERDELRRKRHVLLLVRGLLAVTLTASAHAFRLSSLFFSQCVLLAYFHFAARSSDLVWAYARSKEEADVIDPEKVRAGLIWRGFFMTTILSMVMDSMSMATWYAITTLIYAERGSLPMGLLPASALVVLRASVNAIGLALASKILHDMGQARGGGGVFPHVFSSEIAWAKRIGDHGAIAPHKPLWTAFEGRGITLGRRS